MNKIISKNYGTEVKKNMSNENKLSLFLKLWGPVCIWSLLIFILSNQPNLTLNLPNEFIIRKLTHAVEYAVLTFLFFRALYNSQRKTSASPIYFKKYCIVLSFIIVLLFAVSDEFHQTFVLGRQGTPYDVMIDSLGMMVAGLILVKK